MRIFSFIIFGLLMTSAHAAVPGLINFQGRLQEDGADVNGAKNMKFALVDGSGNNLWTNDGTNLGASTAPTAAVSVTVAKGLYAIQLGATTVIPASVFSNNPVSVRVWADHGGTFQQLSPDQRIVAVGYAVTAANVSGGTVSAQTGSIADNSGGTAFYSTQAGSGATLHAQATGSGVSGFIEIANASNGNTALYANTNGTGRAGTFEILNAANTSSALAAVTNGGGACLRLDQNGSGNIAIFLNNNTIKSFIDSAGAFNPPSDRNQKHEIAKADPYRVLEQVAQMPIATWRYNDAPAALHLGPMAQDFYAAFKLGTDDKHICTVDADGVALAAIQGLILQGREKDKVIQNQGEKINALEARLEALEKLLSKK